METNTNTPEAKQPASAGCHPTPCSAAFEIYELRDLALRALPKREMIRLLTLAGIPPMKSEDRRRELMASRLAHIADRVTIVVKWDHRMPNIQAQATTPAPTNENHGNKQ